MSLNTESMWDNSAVVPMPAPQSAPQNPHFSMTESAAARVAELAAHESGPGVKLRITVEGGGCSGFQYGMSFDAPKDGDQEFLSEGVAVLLDPTSLAYLSGSSVDFDDGLHGKGFEIKNPNAESTCGCGKSFN